jgi:hypothetical protein
MATDFRCGRKIASPPAILHYTSHFQRWLPGMFTPRRTETLFSITRVIRLSTFWAFP